MFENILGHEENKKYLMDNIKSGNISHAYLFTGKKGIGKKTIAEQFAKKVLNTENLNIYPDYKYIAKQEDKKDIVIEQIRKEVIDDIYIRPASGDYKVYIIDDAEFLNISSQNALLKTLEEPPTYVVIILIASSTSNLLTTILSRVTKINFNNIDNNTLKAYIKNNYHIDLEENILDYLDGSIGLASKLFLNDNIKSLKLIDELYDVIKNKDMVECFKKSESIDFLIPEMLEYFEFVLYKQNKLQCIGIIERTKQRLKNNGNYNMVVDNMIMKVIDSF